MGVEVVTIEKNLKILEDNLLKRSDQNENSQNYMEIELLLQSNVHISSSIVKRLLYVCVDDLQCKEEVNVTILNILSSILKKVKVCMYPSFSLMAE
jgi:hypothetical protein